MPKLKMMISVGVWGKVMRYFTIVYQVKSARARACRSSWYALARRGLSSNQCPAVYGSHHDLRLCWLPPRSVDLREGDVPDRFWDHIPLLRRSGCLHYGGLQRLATRPTGILFRPLSPRANKVISKVPFALVGNLRCVVRTLNHISSSAVVDYSGIDVVFGS